MTRSAKFINFILLCILMVFVLMFFYTLAKSSDYPPGHLNKYYIFSVSGCLFFSFIYFKCSAALKEKIVLLAVSLLFSIYAIEYVLSYHFSTVKTSNPRAKLANYLGVPFDSRSKYQIMLDLRSSGIDAYAFHNSTQYMDYEKAEVMPLGFISNKTTIYCNETGEFIIFKSDEHGFNNPDGLYSSDIEYVMIGDSFTLGNCVKRKEHIAGRLIDKGKKVLNLGMGNTGPLYQLGILKEYARPYTPKHVLWFFYEGNDHEGLAHEKRSSILMNYLDDDFSQDLMKKQELVDKVIIESIDKYVAPIKEIMSASRTNEVSNANQKSNLISAKFLSIMELPEIRGRLAIAGKCEYKFDPLYNDIFREAKKVVEGWGGELHFIYLPAWERYQEKTNYCRKRYLNAGKKAVLSVIRDQKIPVLDMENVFRALPDPLSLFPFRIKGHYNSKGYAIVTEHLEKHLTNNQKPE